MKRKILDSCMVKAKSYLHKHPEPYCHFSFVVQSKILEWGINRKAWPIRTVGYPSHAKIHSEVDAYFKAKGIMEKGKFEVVNIRLTKTGMIRNSKPCDPCLKFLSGMGCKRIWFSTNLEKFERIDIFP